MSTYNKKQLEIGKAIKTARKEMGLSQKDFGKVLKVSDKTISSYEVGRVIPKFERVKQISKIVLKPLSYFDQENQTDKDDFELQTQLRKIERELVEIRKIISRRRKQ